MSNKPTILFLSRMRLDSFYIDIINGLKDFANILVLREECSTEKFYHMDGVVVEDDYSKKELFELVDSLDDSKLSELPEIEKKLGLNSHAVNINYMLYEVFTSRYSSSLSNRHNNANVERLFYIRYKQLDNLIEKYHIDYCFFEVVDLVSCFIIEAMTRKGLVKQFFVQALASAGAELRARLTSGLNARSPWLEHVYREQDISLQSYDWAQSKIAEATMRDMASSYDKVLRSNCHIIPRYNIKQLCSKFESFFDPAAIRSALIKIKNRYLSTKYFSDEIGDKKNISVFLQVVPEAGLMSELPEYAHQEILIEQMAIYAKYGYNILVKEHPVGFGNNPASMYKELSLHPNVTILPPTYPTREILLQSKAVVVATGTTVGLEALMLGVPLVTVGKPYFDICKNVFNIERPKDIWDIIDDIEFDKEDQLRFFAALYEATYAYPQYVSDRHFEEGKDAAPVISEALRKEISLYESGVLPCPANI
ncbi:hypothetical protein [Maridesulfovibrio zosterae]|uniref:capsular polysaccharide export protein, LipB/KpsS family n=1 Tax=Maridesulfovibrio zosterae TaxID=82171 RepID=UPI0003F99B82|nr:hypothetical protein [Maridesulfovibrio zosterae]